MSNNRFYPVNGVIKCHSVVVAAVVIISLFRYALGNAERIMLSKNIGWLHTLGNDIDEPYLENKTGGPSIKVNEKIKVKLKFQFQLNW